jgi:hypothetical protein
MLNEEEKLNYSNSLPCPPLSWLKPEIKKKIIEKEILRAKEVSSIKNLFELKSKLLNTGITYKNIFCIYEKIAIEICTFMKYSNDNLYNGYIDDFDVLKKILESYLKESQCDSDIETQYD